MTKTSIFGPDHSFGCFRGAVSSEWIQRASAVIEGTGLDAKIEFEHPEQSGRPWSQGRIVTPIEDGMYGKALRTERVVLTALQVAGLWADFVPLDSVADSERT